MIGNDIICDVGVASAVGIDAIYLNTYKHTADEISSDLKKCNADPNRVVIVEDGDITRASL